MNTLVTVVGPTAVGKTALAIQLAQTFKTSVLSADSRQFYKEMSIGTAKPSLEELAAAPHYFIDNLSIHEPYSVGDFEREALSRLEKLFKVHPVVIMVGGSGLFIDAVCRGLDNLPHAAAGVRDQYNQLLMDKGIIHLQQLLQEKDPVYYQQVDINNPQRLIRALEVIETTGNPFSTYLVQNQKKRSFNILKIGLQLDREELYKRINQRVDIMLQQGLLEEVRRLYPIRQDCPALLTVGYTELFSYIDGQQSYNEAIEKIKQNTRRYAKRQITWFKKDVATRWFHPLDLSEIITYIKEHL